MASSHLAMCHPTPHASKNVKSRPPRNSTKFDVVGKFCETISMEMSVSSSKIYKIPDFPPKILFYPSSQNLGFSGVSHKIYIRNLFQKT